MLFQKEQNAPTMMTHLSSATAEDVNSVTVVRHERLDTPIAVLSRLENVRCLSSRSHAATTNAHTTILAVLKTPVFSLKNVAQCPIATLHAQPILTPSSVDRKSVPMPTNVSLRLQASMLTIVNIPTPMGLPHPSVVPLPLEMQQEQEERWFTLALSWSQSSLL
jgi:hypothetical protein